MTGLLRGSVTEGLFAFGFVAHAPRGAGGGGRIAFRRARLRPPLRGGFPALPRESAPAAEGRCAPHGDGSRRFAFGSSRLAERAETQCARRRRPRAPGRGVRGACRSVGCVRSCRSPLAFRQDWRTTSTFAEWPGIVARAASQVSSGATCQRECHRSADQCVRRRRSQPHRFGASSAASRSAVAGVRAQRFAARSASRLLPKANRRDPSPWGAQRPSAAGADSRGRAGKPRRSRGRSRVRRKALRPHSRYRAERTQRPTPPATPAAHARSPAARQASPRTRSARAPSRTRAARSASRSRASARRAAPRCRGARVR